MNNKEIIAVNEHKNQTSNKPELPKPEESSQVKTDTRTSDIIKPKETPIENVTNGPASVNAASEKPNAKDAETEKALTSSTEASESYKEKVESETTSATKMDSISNTVAINQTPQMDDDKNTDMLAKTEVKKSNGYVTPQKTPANEVEIAKTSNKKRKATNVRETYPASNNNSNSKDKIDNENSNVPAINLTAVDSADYALAKINYDSANYDKCIVNLYYITINPNSKLYEDGLLLKAKTLINQNKKEDAKVALNTIIMLNRSKQKEASELLNKLK